MNRVVPYNNDSRTVKVFMKINDIMDREGGRLRDGGITAATLPLRSRKRNRSALSEEYTDLVVRDIIQYMDRHDLFPTFTTFVDTKFYMLMAHNMEHELIKDLSVFVHEFRRLVALADAALIGEDYETFYNIFVNDMFNLLANAQQPILLFNLQTNSS